MPLLRGGFASKMVTPSQPIKTVLTPCQSKVRQATLSLNTAPKAKDGGGDRSGEQDGSADLGDADEERGLSGCLEGHSCGGVAQATPVRPDEVRRSFNTPF